MLPRNPLHFAEILVCLDGSSYSQAAVEYATQIALEHKASLTGIGVIDLPGLQRQAVPRQLERCTTIDLLTSNTSKRRGKQWLESLKILGTPVRKRESTTPSIQRWAAHFGKLSKNQNSTISL